MLFHALIESPAKAGVVKTAVLNASDPSFEHMRSIPVARQVTYSVVEPADYGVDRVRHDPSGLRFTALTPPGRLEIRSSLLGAYNAANILAAMAATGALGLGPESWAAGVAAVHGIPGRMEVIDEGQGFLAIVDFAHTPNALEHALGTAHEMVGPRGRVIAVFGCAGLRDPGKRLEMGRVAAETADLTVVTAEDPRTEDLDAVLATIAQGIRSGGGREGTSYWLVRDRAEALRHACRLASPGDVVISCGKGHEPSMCFGNTEYPWDDRAALRAALRGEDYSGLPTALSADGV
jgi:UDP-N-acetylmuramoyl-L-alanyl-D-glutamate--2,6-diaminopimelate ligase